MAWKRELTLMLYFLLPSAAAGFFTSYWCQSLFIGLAVYLAWHLYHLKLLHRNLTSKDKSTLKVNHGLWQEVYSKLTWQREKRHYHRRRLISYLDEFREAAKALPDGVLILDASFSIDWCNPSATKLLGVSCPENIGKPLMSVMRHPILREYLESGDYSKSLLIKSPADHAKVASIDLVPFGASEKRYLLHVRDVTQSYYLEENQRDFIANVSHELRTPLTVIQGYLETLMMSQPDSELSKNALASMEAQADRMRNTISDLLALSQIENKMNTPSTAPIPFYNLLDEVLDELRPLLDKHGHTLTRDVDKHLGLDANPGEIRSLISNLVVNAIKHTPAGCHIRVSWRREDDAAVFEVSDTGEGIAPRHIPRLTERFYRIEEGASVNSTGTGLGLAIASKVIKRHGGDMKITSELGKGSQFICYFPNQRLIALTE